jgi:polar amino acid transport system substrate-binding protein
MRKGLLRLTILIVSGLFMFSFYGITYADENLLDQIKKRGVLNVGAQSIMPAILLDEKTNKLIGVDGEVAEAIARELGVKVNKLETSWEGLIPGLNAKKYDTIISGMYIKPDRQKVVDFTQPYYGYGEGLAVSKGNPLNIHTDKDLSGKRVGLQEGAAYLEWFQKNMGGQIDFRIYKNIPEMTIDLDAGRIDAFLTDEIIIAWDIRQHPELKIELVKEYKSKVPGRCGAAVRKGNPEFLNKLNEIISKMKSSGELLEILKRYGLSENNLPD